MLRFSPKDLLPMCLCAVLVLAPAAAAPLKPDAGQGPSTAGVHEDQDAADTPATDWTAEAVPGTGRTMELLLEMQKNTPADRPAPAPDSARKAPAATAAAPTGLAAQGLNVVAPMLPTAPVRADASKPALFGTTAEPAIRPSAGPEPAWEGAPRSGSPTQRPQRPASELPRWMLWPAEFVAWLRDNRYTVVAGAATTLLVVWLGSVVIGRRRYAG